MEARCEECDEFLTNPKNVTHITTEADSMIFAMNCGNCNAMNKVGTSVGAVDRI